MTDAGKKELKAAYPDWKKAAWEAWRIFGVAFLAVIAAQFEAGVNLYEWKAWGSALLLAAIAAGVKALVKWLREKYGLGDYQKLIYKLPL